jgi:hypothetical protein
MLEGGTSRVRDSVRPIIFFNWTDPFSRTRPRGYEARNRNEYQKQNKMFLGSRARPARKADNFTAICELIV